MSQLEDLARLSGDCEGKVEVKCSAVFQALMDLRVRYRVCPCSLHMGMRDAQIQLWITERTVTRQQAWVTLRFGGNKDEKKKKKTQRIFSAELSPESRVYEDIISVLFSSLCSVWKVHKDWISRSNLHEVPSWANLLYKSVRNDRGGLHTHPRVSIIWVTTVWGPAHENSQKHGWWPRANFCAIEY